jgi:hypothetical protein
MCQLHSKTTKNTSWFTSHLILKGKKEHISKVTQVHKKCDRKTIYFMNHYVKRSGRHSCTVLKTPQIRISIWTPRNPIEGFPKFNSILF